MRGLASRSLPLSSVWVELGGESVTAETTATVFGLGTRGLLRRSVWVGFGGESATVEALRLARGSMEAGPGGVEVTAVEATEIGFLGARGPPRESARAGAGEEGESATVAATETCQL